MTSVRYDCQQTPLPRNTSESVEASVFELETGAGDQIPHRAQDEHLAGLGEGRDAGRDMHRDPA